MIITLGDALKELMKDIKQRREHNESIIMHRKTDFRRSDTSLSKKR